MVYYRNIYKGVVLLINMEEIIQTKEDSVKLIRSKDGTYNWTITLNGNLSDEINKLKEHDEALKKIFN